ncbi:hypothetical protein [Streptomyces sp. NPDC048277]|uniref:hypothetical protein n=1 Tax=Streptomyces sp. NPDC048277 TaxID=3155027 RepID=UPI0033FA7BA5
MGVIEFGSIDVYGLCSIGSDSAFSVGSDSAFREFGRRSARWARVTGIHLWVFEVKFVGIVFGG